MRIPLTSTDCFLLALEKWKAPQGASGNTCRYILDLEGVPEKGALEKSLNASEELVWLASLKIEKPFLGIPKWKHVPRKVWFEVNVIQSDERIPVEVLNTRLSFEEEKLFEFHLVLRSDGTSALIFSWHHLVLDGYGAVLLLKRLLNGTNGPKPWERFNSNAPWSLQLAWRTIRLFAYNTYLFWSPGFTKTLSGPGLRKIPLRIEQGLRVIRFSREESLLADQNGQSLGAKFGRSPFFLGAIAWTVASLLKKRGTEVKGFWIPQPQDKRRKGALGPLLGNHLSFLFYRIKPGSLASVEDSVQTFHYQMVEQIRHGKPKAYERLLRAFRRIPSWIYYQLIKGPQGGTVASFLFTMAADHSKDLTSVLGCRITDATSLPPNTFPPGLTFAFSRFEGELTINILYYREVLQEQELNYLESQLRQCLLSPKEVSHA